MSSDKFCVKYFNLILFYFVTCICIWFHPVFALSVGVVHCLANVCCAIFR